MSILIKDQLQIFLSTPHLKCSRSMFCESEATILVKILKLKINLFYILTERLETQ